jgi:chromosome segregation ATPase
MIKENEVIELREKLEAYEAVGAVTVANVKATENRIEYLLKERDQINAAWAESMRLSAYQTAKIAELENDLAIAKRTRKAAEVANAQLRFTLDEIKGAMGWSSETDEEIETRGIDELQYMMSGVNVTCRFCRGEK